MQEASSQRVEVEASENGSRSREVQILQTDRMGKGVGAKVREAWQEATPRAPRAKHSLRFQHL